MAILEIKELSFSAMHYIPGHPKCGALHGHTFYVRNIRIDCADFVDFGDIKAVVATWDHKALIPQAHIKVWTEQIEPALRTIGARLDPKTMEDIATVENIIVQMAKELKALKNVEDVSLEVFEGPNQGVLQIGQPWRYVE